MEMATGKVTPSGHSQYVVYVSWSQAWKARNMEICAKKFLTDHDDIIITVDIQCTGISVQNKIIRISELCCYQNQIHIYTHQYKR